LKVLYTRLSTFSSLLNVESQIIIDLCLGINLLNIIFRKQITIYYSIKIAPIELFTNQILG